MIRCLDIHTHHPAPQPEGVVSVSIRSFNPIGGQFYSLGIHPWDTGGVIEDDLWNKFKKLAASPSVVAIGECGIDKFKGGPVYRQMIVMQRQIEISEELNKPLIIHDVKAHDIIVGLKRDLKPSQPWVIHGFRGKPSLAKMMTDAGIYLSFGEKFNPETPLTVPPHLILAETDESPLSIQQIIAGLSSNMGRDITSLIQLNTRIFLFGSRCDLKIENDEF